MVVLFSSEKGSGFEVSVNLEAKVEILRVMRYMHWVCVIGQTCSNVQMAMKLSKLGLG